MERLSLPYRLSPRLDRTPPHRLPELMDSPDCDAGALREALDVLARSNRYLGGWSGLWRQLNALLVAHPVQTLDVLDVGAGGGDLARRVSTRLAARGWKVRVVLADLHLGSLTLARERWPRASGFVRLTGTRLPFANERFDVAYSTTTLHHLERKEAVQFLSELGRVTRLGWVVTDLKRSRLSLTAVSLLAATVWRTKRFFPQDGPNSVRRSFTPAEMGELLAEAGLRDTRIEAGPFRMAVRGEHR